MLNRRIAVFAAFVLLCSGAAAAQPHDGINAPNNQGIITNNQSGGHNTINNYGPPHRINTLYDADLELGIVDGQIILSDDKKQIMFGKMKYYDGFPWGKIITFVSRAGALEISCPEKQDCPKGMMCMTGQDNLSGQMMNDRAPVICDLK